MDSTRQNKISRLIQKELSDILLKLAKETRGIMVSVSIVRVSPDLGVAKAYLSVFPSEKGTRSLITSMKISRRYVSTLATVCVISCALFLNCVSISTTRSIISTISTSC